MQSPAADIVLRPDEDKMRSGVVNTEQRLQFCCGKIPNNQETRDGSETTTKRVDFTTEPLFHADRYFE
jgi:hypothetical protein